MNLIPPVEDLELYEEMGDLIEIPQEELEKFLSFLPEEAVRIGIEAGELELSLRDAKGKQREEIARKVAELRKQFVKIVGENARKQEEEGNPYAAPPVPREQAEKEDGLPGSRKG